MSDYFLTYLWTWMECFSAILLFDAFSARKMKRFRHWIIVTSLAFLEATFLNIASKALPDYSKILIALVLYYFVHRILYISNRFFGLYISIIIYATMCCIDNLWHTLALLLSETLNGVFLGNALCQSMLVHGIIIVVCFLQAKARNGKLSQATNFRWYTIPAVLSLASVLLIFFFGSCFQQGQISIQPLCVCATFITVMQIAALLLISWMEQNANFREEAISLQAKSKAQQESIEALSAAYAQQRKLTHDFRAHLSTLDGMLMQQNIDINKIQTYIHSLQSKQNERILLVNTHHAALDALLNQKALVAKNRKIDIQFSVNDLSPIKIDMVDLTVVISNTLDNAIEACEKLPETDRQIYVQALLEEDELFYAIRNKSLPVNMIANQLPASTKENPSFHGYGLQNVHTTLEKYHTLYAMDYENGWFEFATVCSCFITSLFCEYACLYLIDRLQSSTIAATITLLIVSVTLILTLAPCNNSAIHCSNEELQDMKIAVRKRLVLYCLLVPPLLLLKPLYSTVWIVAAAADALLLVLAKIGVGIK